MSAGRGSQSRCSLPGSMWIWSWVGRAAQEIAKASRLSLLGRNVPIGSDLVTLFLKEKEEGELGGEVAPWRHPEQVAFGSFRLRSHQPRVTGLEQ